MRNKLKKYLLTLGTMIVILAIAIPAVSAYEGHLIDVKTHLELSEARINEIYCESATRSAGWWQTHVDAAYFVLHYQYADNINMGWLPPVTNIEDLMGIFWASQTFDYDPLNSPNYKGEERDDLNKAKAQASFQVLAAILNAGSPTGAWYFMPYELSDIRKIMNGYDIDAIKRLHDDMAAYNLSFDFTERSLGIPNLYLINATPGEAQDIANIAFANSP